MILQTNPLISNSQWSQQNSAWAGLCIETESFPKLKPELRGWYWKLNLHECVCIQLVVVNGEVCVLGYYGIFCLNCKRGGNEKVISNCPKKVFFQLYPTKMKCSVLEQTSCLIQTAIHFVWGTLKWNISFKNISDFCSSPVCFFNQA